MQKPYAFALTLVFGLTTAIGAHADDNRTDLATQLKASMEANVATENNLETFELVAPILSEKDKEDLALNDELERLQEEEQKIADAKYQEPQMFVTAGQDKVSVEIYQNAPSIGKQFLVVRNFGKIIWVFAVSAAAKGHSTPTGTFSPQGQSWRHMSATYPSKGENNMDHVTYFKPMYGFHSTTFGAYWKLGTRDSHGCVRLARPQARAVYSLIKQYRGSVGIYSYGSGDPDQSDLSLIRKYLARDFNYIQRMLKEGNKGDVPFNESQYFQFIRGEISFKQATELGRRNGIPNIFDIRAP